MKDALDEVTRSRIIEMAWEDRTPFDIIESRFDYSEKAVIRLMRRHLNRRAFENWRARVSGRKTKHAALRSKDITRGYCRSQYKPQGAG